tara:strand:+ start:1956 stop:2426 length:471 start_codon:yes stop_codon:yes gene_type:complete
LSHPINKLKSIVNFYSLEKKDNIDLSVCKIVRKLYKENKNVMIMDNDDNLTKFDKLLWSFEQNTFLPHKILFEDDVMDTPIILVSCQNINKLELYKNYSEIINNCEIPLIGHKIFTSIHEFVSNNENDKIVSRSKYTQYKNNNFNVSHRKYNEQTI